MDAENKLTAVAAVIEVQQLQPLPNVRKIINATLFPDDYICSKIYRDHKTRMDILMGNFQSVYEELYELINPPSLTQYLQMRKQKFPFKNGGPASLDSALGRMKYIDISRFWPVAAAVLIQSWWRRCLAKKEMFRLREQLKRRRLVENYHLYLDTCQRVHKSNTVGSLKKRPDLRDYAAVVIQSMYRGYRGRKRLLLEQQQQQRPQSSQRPKTPFSVSAAAEEEIRQRRLQQQINACSTIQRWWHRVWSIKQYRMYRDLVTVLNHSDPKELLRVVNPREAELCDPAVTPSIQIRLGGVISYYNM